MKIIQDGDAALDLGDDHPALALELLRGLFSARPGPESLALTLGAEAGQATPKAEAEEVQPEHAPVGTSGLNLVPAAFCPMLSHRLRRPPTRTLLSRTSSSPRVHCRAMSALKSIASPSS